jgi:transposase-like protein
MSQSTRTYTEGFKQEAVRLLETSGKSGAQIASDLGISDSALHHWKREFTEQGDQTFPGKGHRRRSTAVTTRAGNRQAREGYFKISSHHLLTRRVMKYQCIDNHRCQWP